MSVTSKSVDFVGKNLVSCGCSSNASFHRYNKVRNFHAKVNSKGCGNGARKLVCSKKKNTPQYRVSSMDTAESTLNGITCFLLYKYNCFVDLLHVSSLNELFHITLTLLIETEVCVRVTY